MNHFETIRNILQEAGLLTPRGDSPEYAETGYAGVSDLAIEGGGNDTHVLFTFIDGNLKFVSSDCLDWDEEE